MDCPVKFQNADRTANGSPRAHAAFSGLRTLWVNTGTLCNIECANCYIESSPANDLLAYITLAELAPFLDEAKSMGAKEVGFTGGEPFMNPDMIALAEAALDRGFSVLVLTNAMRPMMRERVMRGLLSLQARHGDHLRLRVSLDHYDGDAHDRERGEKSYDLAVDGLVWLAEHGFDVSVAGRAGFGESDAAMRAGYAQLFERLELAIDAADPQRLVLFPEMDESVDVPEITMACWGLLGKDPRDVMCSTARMVVKRKGAAAPSVLACTLIAYDPQFELGATLDEAARAVSLNHPHCAKFCVLGGASCSA